MKQVFCNSANHAAISALVISLSVAFQPVSALPLLTDSTVTVLQLGAPLQAEVAARQNVSPPAAVETTSDEVVVVASASTNRGTDEANRQRDLAAHISSTYRVQREMATEIVREAFINGAQHDLAPELILAIIAAESTFRPQAVSSQGARGLMQVLPRAHPRKVQAIGGIQALFNPRKNIATGSKILDEYLRGSNGNLDRALRRYSGNSRNYHQKVMRFYRRLKRVGEDS